MTAKPLKTAAKLRRECAKLGLPISGKRADLLKRLQAYRISATAPTLPDLSSSDEDRIECWVATSISSDVSDTIEMAREKLIDAAQNDTLQEETLRNGERAITNPRGTFLSRMREDLDEVRNKLGITDQKLETTTQKLEAANQKLEATAAELTAKTQALFAKTDELERTAAGFRDFRNRFISTFKRDILEDTDEFDRNYIQKGNLVVHNGNVKRDAELYSGLNQRRDFHVFRKLYGILPVIAATIDYRPTIMLLDQHASIISNHRYTATRAFHDKFQEFIAALDRQGFAGNYLETNQEPAQQYWSFYTAIQDEVIEVNE